MKDLLFFTLFLLLFSCGKNNTEKVISTNQESAVPPYDTIAKDSFSAGAVSVDVARRIKMSSQKYQDSLREVKRKLEEEKLANKLKEEKDKADKKLEEEKKRAEEDARLKREKEKQKSDAGISETPTHP
ncbi:hypothetical protein [Chryseobacterium koreense]|uniref:Lipoprotein n=1 Tax=Chryseobacterium koreense CCUG 49689 TaxID=1304281 RepID=A0A0J7LN25_9FLAO|nr:hypothetical protein [Chryseobacterium koreense]KMQ70490.1 hypothetical protein ACM44_11890 [Chryseobacterium koreense CCUG 49689]MBB5332296.1 Skp family chaperone for outer membrane proteins [Chryseobacterium koreense]